MNELAFAFGDNLVRIVEKDNATYFVAKDVAEILEYRNAPDMTRYLDDDEVSTLNKRSIIGDDTQSQPGNPNLIVISESGLYHSIFQSRKPQAAKFRRWVTDEVLPQIRKTGSYGTSLSLMPKTELTRAEASKVKAMSSLIREETNALEKLEKLHEKGLIPAEDFSAVLTEFLRRARTLEPLAKMHGKDIEDDSLILSFVSEKLEITENHDDFVLFEQLYEKFSLFCSEEKLLPKIRFRHRMETLFQGIEYSHKTINGFPTAGYYGIRMKEQKLLPAGGINTCKEANE